MTLDETLDDAIKKEEDGAEHFRHEASYFGFDGDAWSEVRREDLRRWADERQQYAEWLKELKRLRRYVHIDIDWPDSCDVCPLAYIENLASVFGGNKVRRCVIDGAEITAKNRFEECPLIRG